jgi:hypothetical protein
LRSAAACVWARAIISSRGIGRAEGIRPDLVLPPPRQPEMRCDHRRAAAEGEGWGAFAGRLWERVVVW